MKSLIAGILALSVAACASSPSVNTEKNLVDVGGYEIDLREFSSWRIEIEKPASLVMISMEGGGGGDTTQFVRFWIVRITLPKNLRGEAKEKIAQQFCEGTESFVQKKFFPTYIEQNWERAADVRIDCRVAIVYSGYNDHPSKVRPIPPGAPRAHESGRAYVWFPDSFPRDGNLFIIAGFEAILSPPGGFREIGGIQKLLPAIRPK